MACVNGCIRRIKRNIDEWLQLYMLGRKVTKDYGGMYRASIFSGHGEFGFPIARVHGVKEK